MTMNNDQLEQGLGTLLTEVVNRGIQISGTLDPSAGAGVAAPVGATYIQKNVGGAQVKRWGKTGLANTAWTEIGAGGGSGGGIKGDWDVTPTTSFAVNQVNVIGGTYTIGTGVFQSNLGPETSYMIGPYPAKAAVLKTDVNIDALVVGQSRRFGFKISQVPAAGQVLIMGLAPSTMTAAQFKTAMSDYLMGTPPAAPFFMVEVVNFGGLSAHARAHLQNDTTTATIESVLTGSAAPAPAAIAVNDGMYFLIGRHNDTGLGQDVLSLSSVLIRDADSAFNIGSGDTMAENPQLPTGMRVFFGLLSIDIGGGFSDIEITHDFDSAPTSYDVTGTTFENTATQADFNVDFPAPITGVQVYTQQPFPVGTAVNDMYRIQSVAAPVAATPYGTPVSDEQIIVVDDVGVGTEAFQILADQALAEQIAQQYDQLLVSQITEASRRAGEMLFYVTDAGYVGVYPLTGQAVYSSFDAAYEAAILYPKFIAKILVVDDRAGITINEPVGGKTYLLAENNIWLAGYSRWAQDSEESGYGGMITLAARVDALLVDHAGVNIQPSSETAGPTVNLSAVVAAPWGNTTGGVVGVASMITFDSVNAVDTSSGGSIVLGESSGFTLSGGMTPAAMLYVYVGANSSISCIPGGASPIVTVVTPRNYEFLGVNANVTVTYDNDDGFQALYAAIEDLIPYNEPFVVYCGYQGQPTSYWTNKNIPATDVFASNQFAAAVARAQALAGPSIPGKPKLIINGEVRIDINTPVDLDGLYMGDIHYVGNGSTFWRHYNNGSAANAQNAIFEGIVFHSLASLGGKGSASESMQMHGGKFLNCRLAATSNDGGLVDLSGDIEMDGLNVENTAISWFKVDSVTSIHFSRMKHGVLGTGHTWLYSAGGTVNVTSPTAPVSRVGNTVCYGISGTYAFIRPSVLKALATPDGRTAEEAFVPTAWTAATLLNSWAAQSGYEVASYRKTGYDLVQLRGAVDAGTGLPILTLPVGSRPPAKLRFVVDVLDGSNAPVTGDITIDTDGTVAVLNPGTMSNHKVSFGTITFSTTP